MGGQWGKWSWELSGSHFGRFSAFFSILPPFLVNSGSILGHPGSNFINFGRFFLLCACVCVFCLGGYSIFLGCWVVVLLGSWVLGFLSCWVALFLGCWVVGWFGCLLVVGLLGCWVVGLVGCWIVELDCWFVGLLLCWSVGLLVCCCPGSLDSQPGPAECAKRLNNNLLFSDDCSRFFGKLI